MTILKNYPKEALFFIIASFINSMGNALMWPLTTLYVHNVLHRSYGDAGFVLLLQSTVTTSDANTKRVII